MNKIKKIDCKRFLQIVNGTIDKDFKNIRMVKSYSWSLNGNSTYNYAYLGLKDRIVVSADYGFAKYKGYELLNCEECYENNPQLRMKDIFTGEEC